MSYCVNPSCPEPKNPDNAVLCQACGSKLLLRDRYQVLGILGKGGFGATFATLDLSLPNKSLCVVKQLRPSNDDPNIFRMAKELFIREAETLGKVGVHPQVPRLLDYFEENQQFYLVQEYIKGHNLHQEVKKHGPFSEAGVKQFLTELLPIITYIHGQKVIHRDIKPANLIRRQTDKKLVLIDFGAVKNQVNSVVATSSSPQSAFTAFAVGTAGFAPPEQMAMRPVYASDIYAIGVTCIYLLSGKSPKDLGTDPETGEIIWESWVQISDSFAEVLRKMLEVSVRHRYKSAQEVLDALELTDYSTSLEESMVTMANLKPAGTGEKSLGFPSSTFKTPDAPSGVITKVKTGMLTSPRSQRPSVPAPPPKPPIQGESIPARPMGANFQMAAPPRAGRDKTKKETLVQKQHVKLDARTIIAMYEKGQKDFAQEELNAINLSRAKLPGINLYQCLLTKSNFLGADLSNSNLGRANLYQAVLRNANLNQTYLSHANLEYADLRGADLTSSNLKYANLRGANLCGANLLDAQVTQEQIAQAKTNWLTVMPSGKRGFW